MMQKIINIIRWTVAIIVGILGLILIGLSVLTGISVICAAFVVSPLFKKVFNRIFPKVVFKEWIRIVLCFLFFILFIIGIMITDEFKTQMAEAEKNAQLEQEETEWVTELKEEKNDTKTDSSREENLKIEESILEKIEENISEEKEDNFTEVLSNEEYQRFIEACNEAQFDTSLVKGLKRIDDWASGKRYSFVYKGNGCTLYMLENGYVDGINLGAQQIYKDGYEAKNINDYLIDIGVLSELEVIAEGSVKNFLKHPSTADFHWLTQTSAYRTANVYTISSNVTAENSFGVEDNVPFTVQIDQNSKNIVYVNVDGKVELGSIVEEKKAEKTASKIESSSSGGILLIDGQEGEYGVLDEKLDIIFYYLPAGTYDVVSQNKGMIFVTNPKDTDDSTVYNFSASGDSAEVVIPEGYYVELMINTIVEFNKK